MSTASIACELEGHQAEKAFTEMASAAHTSSVFEAAWEDTPHKTTDTADFTACAWCVGVAAIPAVVAVR